MPSLLQAVDAGVLTLTLNRPDKGNALHAELIEQLHGALERAELDAGVRVVVVRGAGQDFCAGADLDELLASVDRTLAENEQSALRLGLLFLRLRELPKPVVAVVHGRALAGGAGLATACDLVIAAQSAEIGYPEIRRGFVPAMVMALLRRLVGEKLALDLVLTGRTLKAPNAAAVGLLSRVVPDADLEHEVAALVSALITSSSSTLALTKQLFYRLDVLSLTDGVAAGAKTNALVRSMPDFQDAIARFLRR